jgi:hypothetical protein
MRENMRIAVKDSIMETASAKYFLEECEEDDIL